MTGSPNPLRGSLPRSRRPNFLVTAVPRSGTTFLARALNGHGHVLCGEERFTGPHLSPDRLTVEGFRTMDRERIAAARQDAMVEAKAVIGPDLAIGEKCPRAYLHLDAVLPRFADARRPLHLFAVVRDVRRIDDSWLRRARNEDDASWDRGQHGIFPHVEMAMLVSKLLDLPPDLPSDPPCLVVPYDDLVAPDAQARTFAAMMAHLGVPPDDGMMAVAREGRGLSRRSAERPPEPTEGPHGNRFVSEDPFFARVLAVARERGPAPLGALRDAWADALAELHASRTFFEEAVQRAAMEADPAVRRYMARMAPAYRGALTKLDRPFAEALLARMASHETASRPTPTAPVPKAPVPKASAADPTPASLPVPSTDHARVAASRGATQAASGQAPSDATPPRAAPSRQACGPVRHYDMTDLVAFVLRTGRMTGVQRVQRDAILGAVAAEGLGQRRAVHFDADHGWRAVDVEELPALLADARDATRGTAEETTQNTMAGRLAAFHEGLAERPEAVFAPGDVLTLTGATWNDASLLTSLRELKAAGVRLVFYMHDVLPLSHPHFFEPVHVTLKRQWLRDCATLADGVTCNSGETRAAFLAASGYEGPVTVVDLNVRPPFLPAPGTGDAAADLEALRALDLHERPFALMVGTIEPRKNHLTAIDAWQSLAAALGDACPTLVVAGQVGWMVGARMVVDVIEQEGERRRLVHLPDVGDALLGTLYRSCAFLLQLSRAEGWGLPVTEALASGAACVVGRGSSAAAARQGVALEVDERSERDVATRIEALLRGTGPEGGLAALREKAAKARFGGWADFARDLASIEASFGPPADPRDLWPTIVPGHDYRFGSRAGQAPLPSGPELQQGGGWHRPDEWGVWTNGREAQLRFHLPRDLTADLSGDFPSGLAGDPPSDGAMHLYAALIVSERHRPADASVLVDGALAWKGRVRPGLHTLARFRVSPTDGGPVTVAFHTNDALDMSTTGSADARTLGLGLIELRAVPEADVAGRLETLEAMTARYVDR